MAKWNCQWMNVPWRSSCCTFEARCFAGTSSLSTFVSFLFSFSLMFSVFFFLSGACISLCALALYGCRHHHRRRRRRCCFLFCLVCHRATNKYTHVKLDYMLFLLLWCDATACARKHKIFQRDNIGVFLEYELLTQSICLSTTNGNILVYLCAKQLKYRRKSFYLVCFARVVHRHCVTILKYENELKSSPSPHWCIVLPEANAFRTWNANKMFKFFFLMFRKISRDQRE